MKYLDNYGEPLTDEAVELIAAALQKESRHAVAQRYLVPQKTLKRIAAARDIR